jgi:hypothetical protein
VVCAEVLVFEFGVGEHVVEHDQQGVGHGDDGPVGAARRDGGIAI